MSGVTVGRFIFLYGRRMVKQCGYFPGYCLNPGKCDLDVEGWPEPVRWDKITKAAAKCKWRISKSRATLEGFYRDHIYSQQKVGNPYE